MPSELQNLATIFNRRIFRIPDFQRGFAWCEDRDNHQLNDFWEDLDRLQSGRSHYTGQLTLEKVNGNAWKHWEDDIWLIEAAGYQPYYVIDGQQRLTTAIIIVQ